MARFYEGYWESRADVQKMNEEELLDLIDTLFGRDNLPEDYTLEELRQEALEQHKQEWTTPEGRESEEMAKAFVDAVKGTRR